MIEQDSAEFKDLLPELRNQHVTIPKKLKPFYHAFCVISGNFSSLLWQKAFQEFEKKLNFPKEILHPYLEQIFLNLKNEPENALTGPLVRSDKKTVLANLDALSQDPYQEIYQAFVKVYKNT